MIRRRTAVEFHSRSARGKGRSMSPRVSGATTSYSCSARVGGVALIAVSGIEAAVDLVVVPDQHSADVIDEVLKGQAGAGIMRESRTIELSADLTGMRRQHGDAGADDHRFLDRMGDEDERKADVFPQLQQFVLHLAPRQRIE